MRRRQIIRRCTQIIGFIFFFPPILGLWLWPTAQSTVFCSMCPSMMPNMLLINKTWVWGAMLGLLFWLLLMICAFLFGRWYCGWFCPIGLLQELLNKIPLPKVDLRDRDLSYIKWGFLSGWVITGIFPQLGHLACATCIMGNKLGWIWALILRDSNYLCYYDCRMQLIFGAIFYLFCLFFVGRTWCRTFCFVGQSTGLSHWIGVLSKRAKTVNIDEESCKKCGRCLQICPTGAIINVGDKKKVIYHECVMCGLCWQGCPVGAITYERITQK